MELAGWNQLLANEDFPTGRGLGKKGRSCCRDSWHGLSTGKGAWRMRKRGTVLGDKLVTDYKLWKGDLAEDLELATSAFPSPRILMPAMFTESFNYPSQKMRSVKKKKLRIYFSEQGVCTCELSFKNLYTSNFLSKQTIGLSPSVHGLLMLLCLVLAHETAGFLQCCFKAHKTFCLFEQSEISFPAPFL